VGSSRLLDWWPQSGIIDNRRSPRLACGVGFRSFFVMIK
jgi:hypothetical protein